MALVRLPPDDWSPNIVQGKTCDLGSGEGRRVWEACEAASRAIGIALLRARGTILLPRDPRFRPDRERLAWHRDTVFKGA